MSVAVISPESALLKKPMSDCVGAVKGAGGGWGKAVAGWRGVIMRVDLEVRSLVLGVGEGGRVGGRAVP